MRFPQSRPRVFLVGAGVVGRADLARPSGGRDFGVPCGPGRVDCSRGGERTEP